MIIHICTLLVLILTFVRRSSIYLHLSPLHPVSPSTQPKPKVPTLHHTQLGQLLAQSVIHIWSTQKNKEDGCLLLKMKPLNFKSVEFYGFDRMEPPVFDNNVNKYTIHRKAGSNFCFRAELNRAPVPKTEDDGWNHQPYPGFTQELSVSGNVYKSFWSPGEWAAIEAGPGVTEVCISCCLGKRARLEGEKTFYISLTVHTDPLTEEERKVCTHPSTRTTEGEFWGGGSGSCTVEMITSCTVCGTTTSTSHEHRD